MIGLPTTNAFQQLLVAAAIGCGAYAGAKCLEGLQSQRREEGKSGLMVLHLLFLAAFNNSAARKVSPDLWAVAPVTCLRSS